MNTHSMRADIMPYLGPLFMHAPVGMAACLDGMIIHANPAWEAMFGYAPNELAGQRLDAVLPDLHGCAGAYHGQEPAQPVATPARMKGERGLAVQVRWNMLDVQGTPFTMLYVEACAPQPQESPAHADSTAGAYETCFGALFDAMPMGIILADADGHVVDINPVAQRMLGYSAAELRATGTWHQHMPDVAALARTAQSAVNKRINITRSWTRKDGYLVWMDMSITIAQQPPDAAPVCVIAIDDTSSNVHAANMRARIAAVLDSSDDAIIGKSLDGTILTWNMGATRLYGYTPEQAIGQPAAMLLPPNWRDEEAYLRASVLRGDVIRHFESVRVRRDGSHVDVALTVSPIMEQDGHCIGMSTIARDITTHKQAQAALQWQTTLTWLLQAVAVAANQSASLEEALQITLDHICESINWPVGHAYLPDPARAGKMISTTMWHVEQPDRFAALRAATELPSFEPASEFPGIVFTSGTQLWLADIASATYLQRHQTLCDVGVQTGFAFPVLLGEEVIAVLEFFTPTAHPPDYPLLDVMFHVGSQLSRVVERERSEAALRESNERYRLIAEHTADIIVLIDQQQRAVYTSPSLLSIFGYETSQIVGASVFDLVHPDDRVLAATELQRAFTEGVGITTVRGHTKDGEQLWISVRGTAIRQHGENYVLMVAHNVTERRLAEMALRDAERRYRSLVEQIPAIIYTAAIDDTSSTSYVSPQIEEVMGFTPEEWQSHPDLWIAQIHPNDRAAVMETVMLNRTDSEPRSLEYRAFTRDRQLLWLQDTARVVRDEHNRPLFMQGITLDITDRKHAEAALRHAETRYRTLVAQIPAIIYTAIAEDPNVMSFVSRYIEQLLGYTPEEWLASPQAWMAHIHPDDLPAVLQGVQHVATTTDTVILEYRAFKRDGELVWLRDSTKMIYDEYGEPSFIQGIMIDVTARKQAEDALAEERTLLARRVEERTADLSAANAALARAARLKDEFLASMSHELRTPLNAVLGLTEALRERVYGELQPQQDHALQTIEESGRHLLELINDILDLAKMGAGKMDIDPEDVLVEQVVQASMRMLRQAAQKKGVSLQSSIDSQAVRVLADPRRLKQMLVNLLANAVKFTPRAGQVGLDVTVDAAQQTICFAVSDTGIGIEAEELPLLFQPFVQLDRRLSRQYEGTGLGLALVFRMAEMHGGSVSAASTPGVGSRFTVTLPWHEPDVTCPNIPNPVPVTHPLRRALIVDDSPTAATQLTRYLHELGIRADVCARGTEALPCALATMPDFIALDLLLPDITGWEVLAQLRADPRTSAIPVVIVSVIDQDQRFNTASPVYHVQKPFTRNDVHAVINSILGSNVLHEAPQAAKTSAHGATVLLVEDTDASRMAIADHLALIGYRVITARTGSEAIMTAQEAHPDVILMDIQMPGMDGMEAMRHIRADRAVAATPIIALTALAMPGDRERCLAAGANDYLSKPVSLKQLAALLQLYVHRTAQSAAYVQDETHAPTA